MLKVNSGWDADVIKHGSWTTAIWTDDIIWSQTCTVVIGRWSHVPTHTPAQLSRCSQSSLVHLYSINPMIKTGSGVKHAGGGQQEAAHMFWLDL